MYKKIVLVTLSAFLLSGCLDKYTNEPIKDKDTVTSEVEILPEEQNSAMENMPVISKEEAAENASKLYKTSEIKEYKPKIINKELLDVNDLNCVSQYSSYYFVEFMRGTINPKKFVDAMYDLFDEDYKAQLGSTKEEIANTLNLVQLNYYSNIPQRKIASYFISTPEIYFLTNTESIKSVYRRHVLEDGEEIFFEMIFEQKKDGWKLVEDKPTGSPYNLAVGEENNDQTNNSAS
ncbi:hypothetical protein ACQKMI_24350 [Lysinibacillus sp. NPDC097214]|uniref:hypothetical protein n=1 Tax=Lysinibacillus sp. NPDC097214 TaxID=3390584 RepID=UPI003D0100FA